MIPENLMQLHDSKEFMTIEVHHTDTLASLRDEDNTFISGTSTISTRSGLTGLEPRHRSNAPPKTRRINRQESLTSSTIVEKSPIDSYEQPRSIPEEKTVIILPLEGRPVLQLEEEDITIKMLKTLHAQLQRELQDKKERNERKKRMKRILREEKEKERRAVHTRRGSGDTELYSREQEIRDLQLIQEKLKEQKRIEQQIAEQIRRENINREQRSVRDDRRSVVPAKELLHDAKKSFTDYPYVLELSEHESSLSKNKSKSNMRRFSEDSKRSPASRDAPKQPARRSSPDELEPISLVSTKMSQMSMRSPKPPTGIAIEPTREAYVPSEEDTAVGTFVSEAYSSLEPLPFCSAVDSVKLARGEYFSSEDDDTFVGTFVSEGASSLFSNKEPLENLLKKDDRPNQSNRQRSSDDWENKQISSSQRVGGRTSTINSEQKPALPKGATTLDDSFSLLSL